MIPPTTGEFYHTTPGDGAHLKSTMTPRNSVPEIRRDSAAANLLGKRKRTKGESLAGDPWNNVDIHRSFVSAIFDQGLKHASPSVILQNMMAESDELTSERIKSHLQKYRKNKMKSKQDFMSEYDDYMRQQATRSSVFPFGSPPSTTTTRSSAELTGGSGAAMLTCSLLSEAEGFFWNLKASLIDDEEEHADPLQDDNAAVLELTLTEEEKKSYLGQALTHVMSMVAPMRRQLLQERRREHLKSVEAAAASKEREEQQQAKEEQQEAKNLIPATNAERFSTAADNPTSTSSRLPSKMVWGDSSSENSFYEVTDEHHSVVDGTALANKNRLLLHEFALGNTNEHRIVVDDPRSVPEEFTLAPTAYPTSSTHGWHSG